MKSIARFFSFALALCSALMAQTAKVQTFTYKKAGDLEIKVDVHRAPDTVLRPELNLLSATLHSLTLAATRYAAIHHL